MQDSKQIDELFRLMDDVCENGDAALPALEQYLQTQTDAPEIDTEASLKKFKADHKEFFVKPHRGRRLCYRIFVVAAAVFAAGTVFALTMRRCGIPRRSAFSRVDMTILRPPRMAIRIFRMVHR